MEDRCICCGVVIPEGRMICFCCEQTQARKAEEEQAIELVGQAPLKKSAGGGLGVLAGWLQRKNKTKL